MTEKLTSRQQDLTIWAYNKGYRMTEEGDLLNPEGGRLSKRLNGKGYFTHSMKGGNKTATTLFFHKLQAYQKFGDKMFEPGIHVRHLNGIRTDNSYDNIGIGTQSDNMMDKPKEQRVLDASNPTYDHVAILTNRVVSQFETNFFENMPSNPRFRQTYNFTLRWPSQ